MAQNITIPDPLLTVSGEARWVDGYEIYEVDVFLGEHKVLSRDYLYVLTYAAQASNTAVSLDDAKERALSEVTGAIAKLIQGAL